MASVIIHGFKNDDCAKTFIQWFEGQGEQDQDIWFEDRKDEGLDVTTQYVDCQRTYPYKKDDDGNWIMRLSPAIEDNEE